MSNTAGAVVGALIDRRDGDSGVKGAIGGSLAEGGLKKLVPVLGAIAFAFGARYVLKRFGADYGNDPVAPEA